MMMEDFVGALEGKDRFAAAVTSTSAECSESLQQALARRSGFLCRPDLQQRFFPRHSPLRAALLEAPRYMCRLLRHAVSTGNTRRALLLSPALWLQARKRQANSGERPRARSAHGHLGGMAGGSSSRPLAFDVPRDEERRASGRSCAFLSRCRTGRHDHDIPSRTSIRALTTACKRGGASPRQKLRTLATSNAPFFMFHKSTPTKISP